MDLKTKLSRSITNFNEGIFYASRIITERSPTYSPSPDHRLAERGVARVSPSSSSCWRISNFRARDRRSRMSLVFSRSCSCAKM